MTSYSYFIVLCEEMNFSKAAERLFISRQYLSKYVKNLEKEYGISFFEHSGKLTLTPAGQVFLDAARKIDLIETNLSSELADLIEAKQGTIRFAITDGRYRILFPQLINEYRQTYPNVSVYARCDISQLPEELLLNNEIDFAIINQRPLNPTLFEVTPLLSETLYLIISDDLLKKAFPDSFPACKKRFAAGVDLKDFARVPFILNYAHPNYRTRTMLEDYTKAENFHLNCIMEMTQNDLHIESAAKSIGACFSWSMYVPFAHKINERGTLSHLNAFPIKDFFHANDLLLITRKNKILQQYTKEFIRLIKANMKQYARF